MFCPKCGYNYGDESSNFCPKCGAPLNNQLAEPEEEEDTFVKKPFRDEYGNRISDGTQYSSRSDWNTPARSSDPNRFRNLLVVGAVLLGIGIIYSIVSPLADDYTPGEYTPGMTSSRTSSTSTIQKEEASKESAPSSESESSSKPEPAPVVYTATSESLEQLFTDKIASYKTEITHFYYSPDDGNIVIHYNPGSLYNEKAVVIYAIRDYIDYCRYVYAFDDVSSVWMVTEGDFTDSHGNKSVDTVTSIDMSKEAFNSFNWDNLEYVNIYDAFSADCDTFYIHHSVLYSINSDEIFYAAKYDPESFEFEN